MILVGYIDPDGTVNSGPLHNRLKRDDTIIIHHKENIIIKDKPREFGKAISALLKDGERRNVLGKQARKLVSQMYTWDTIGEKLNNVYEELFETSDAK